MRSVNSTPSGRGRLVLLTGQWKKGRRFPTALIRLTEEELAKVKAGPEEGAQALPLPLSPGR